MSSVARRVLLSICCLVAVAIVGTGTAGASSASSPPVVDSLTTEHMVDPLGIDTGTPLLGWVITSGGRGVSQSKYEIRVGPDKSSVESGNNLVWDSGQVISDRSFDVPYAGPALSSQTSYSWEVRVWDNNGNVSSWSKPASFETAFLDSSQFQGSWIGDAKSTSPTGPELLLRKDFSISDHAIARARLYVSGLSFPYIHIDGQQVSNNVLDTAFTEYGASTPWQIQNGELNIKGGEVGLLKQGANWTDYTMSFDTTPVANQAGWIVRGQDPGNLYLLILDTSDDATGPASSLQEVVEHNGGFSTIKNVSLPFTVTAGTQYHISTAVSGTSVTTSINGTQVASFDASQVPGGGISAGTVGFREDTPEAADFKNLTVTDPTGATLFSSALDQASDLDAFSRPGTNGASVDYRTFDVTSLLHPGTDALAVNLGNGFYAGGADDYGTSGEPWQPNQPKLKLELEVWYTDGTTSTVVSDGSWKVTTGPTTSNDPAVESFDARLEIPGWMQPGFDASSWDNAAVLPAPDAVMRAETIPPVTRTATIDPVKVTDVGTNLPVPSFGGTPTADWIWNATGGQTAIPPGNIFMRKDFTVADPSAISSAVLRVNGDDGDIVFVNGTQVSDSPSVNNGWQTSAISNIKPLLVAGNNVIAIEGINDGGNATSVIAVAQLDSTRIVTDGSWKALAGTPATPPDGWTTANFDDSSWPAAVVTGPFGIGPWDNGIQAPLPPTKVYDFGITTSGWAKITMEGTAGETVDIRYSEKLNSDGTVEGEGENNQTDTYTFAGSGPETYQPKYGWKGYRYIQVWSPSGGPLKIDSITGVVVHTHLISDGSFASSSSLLNEYNTAQKHTILNNQYSFGSDTPVYEKGGWTNDNGDYATSEMDNFNAEAYYDHMMQNFDDAQDGQGNVGFLVPTPPGDDQVDPLWGGSFLLLEFDIYQQYDNLDIIRRDLPNMEAYIDDLQSQIAPHGDIYQGTTFGDWVVPPNDPNPPSSQMLGTMFLYRETEDLSIMAGAIGDTAAQTKYAGEAIDIRNAVNNRFFNSTTDAYDDPAGINSHATGGPNGTISQATVANYDQTANVFGLAFGLAPNGDEQAIANGLAADVVAKGDHLATGANGSKYILPMLTKYGFANLAYSVATNPTAPGWGQWFLQCGATSMWESWEDSSCATARSRDHAFIGTVDDWLYNGVAGIQATSPGFRTVQIDPNPVGGLTSASGSEQTPLGPVSSSWTRSGTSFALTVTVPVGSKATVCVPAASASSVTESGSALANVVGVTVTGMQGSCLQLQVGSGTYKFQSTIS